MAEGVTVVDPASTYVDASVRVSPDAVLWPQTHLRGATHVGAGAQIGPFSVIRDCRIGERSELRAVFADRAEVGDDVTVGPFAHLRPGTTLDAGARVGNFVETKNARLGPGSKANHLTYLGDADIAEEVNVGAGVITCNYDGFFKHRTTVERGAFIGSNVNLVAPVRVGAGAVVGAGSTITRDVPSDGLAVERSETRILPGQAKRRREELARKKAAARPIRHKD
jgi:bifunctional UDP-N-acetylglucosamine pyrophosphorylase/glucosamine-1-phosphate N-acetyltransferase